MSNAKPHDPRTKTSIIRGHMAAGDWRNAIRIAARLPRLDKHRAAILDAQGAYANPRFYTQIGKDAETLIEAGADALCERFGHNQRNTTMETTYSKRTNATRAGKSAGYKLSEFETFQSADGRYGWRLISKRGTERSAKPAKPRRLVDESARDGRKLAKLTGRPTSKRAAVLATAQAGKLPPPPDFSAPTHARYRDALKELVALAKAGNIEALKALEFKTYSSSPKAMAKYRDLAVIALEARRGAADSEAA